MALAGTHGGFPSATRSRTYSSSSLVKLLPSSYPTGSRFLVKNELFLVSNKKLTTSRRKIESSGAREFRLFGSRIELNEDLFLTAEEDKEKEEEEIGQGFFEAIEELERREPADVLEEMNNKLSPRELQLVLVYFSQEGRDSWCALEVFEWLNKENKVDKETMDLMISIMCAWFRKLIQAEHNTVADVVDLLVDMDCVGLKPSFSMVEKVISLYWEMGNKENAFLFVKEVLTRGITSFTLNNNNNKGGPTGYLAWKMMGEGDYMGAVKMVIELRECGLKPEIDSYLIAMTAVVKELNEFSKALRKLKANIKAGLIAQLDIQDVMNIDKYESDVVSYGVSLSKWVIQEGSENYYSGIILHERLLAMYICAGEGLKAEQQLWEMKLIIGKEADKEMYDMVLAICASQNETSAVTRLLTFGGIQPNKTTLLWLLRGYVKGGHFEEASHTIFKMLDMGFYPHYLDRAAVMQGLRKGIQHQSGNVQPYLKLCQRLYRANLIQPCMLYVYIQSYQLWVIQMLL